MTITTSQRTTLMRIWAKVCKDRGWKSSDRTLRLATFSKIIGREIASADEIGRIDECTKLMHELNAMLGVSLRSAREADDQTINKSRVLRHQIAAEIIPCMELYIADVRGYITTIMEDKNRWWKIDRPTREMTMMDLDAKPIFRRNKKTGEVEQWPSQLEQMQYTLSARLNTFRNRAGETIHEMKLRAGVPCSCAACRLQIPAPNIDLSPVNQPQEETQPF